MGTTAEQQTPPAPETPAALEAEKGELQDDIKEAKQEAAQARKDGDDERATRIEAAITKTQADLDEIKATLKGMADRPFAPAPGDGEAPPATPPEGEQKQGQEQQQEEKPPPRKKRRHAFFGDRWDQD